MLAHDVRLGYIVFLSSFYLILGYNTPAHDMRLKIYNI